MPSLLPPRRVPKALLALVFFSFSFANLQAKDRYSEFNIGPFHVVSSGNADAARNALTQLEQLRWVLGNLLEAKDLPSLWPIRILLTGEEKTSGTKLESEFVWQNGQFLYVTSPAAPMPLAQVAGLLLDANTPRLPQEVESGVRQLFSTLEAKGSRVTWGGPLQSRNSAAARIQVLATKFQYGTSFHIFLTSLRGGSTLAAAERNAFGKSSAELTKEVQANLVSGDWPRVVVSGRPLDPKRDFGEHSLDPAVARVYLADWTLDAHPNEAESAFKAAVESGGEAAPLGYEGLASVAKLTGRDPKEFWDDAVRAGSRSAPVYVAAAEGLPAVDALPLLKRAAQLNERWAEPVYRQAELAATPQAKEELLRTALKLEPRITAHWVELAQLQTGLGEATAAQGSWLRAEDSAPNEVERSHVHQLRMGSEQERLATAEAARQRERNAAYQADQDAQKEEMARIHAAEQKANRTLDNSSSEANPGPTAVPWDSLTRSATMRGTVSRIDCLQDGWRLWVKDNAGKQAQLFLAKRTKAQLSCGALPRPLRVSLTYKASPDDELHTVGEITSLQMR